MKIKNSKIEKTASGLIKDPENKVIENFSGDSNRSEIKSNEKIPITSRIENSNNVFNVIQIWVNYISDWNFIILEHLELDYPNNRTAENFSVCALMNWKCASEGGGDYWIDELGDTHSEVIDHPTDILWFKSIAKDYYNSKYDDEKVD